MSGMRGVNPRQMKQAMKKMGISNTEVKDVIEVIIRTSSKELVFDQPSVNIMNVQGQDTYQISGPVEERTPGETSGMPSTAIPKEDIELVMSQTNCSRESAIEALEACDGQPAEAILKIMTE